MIEVGRICVKIAGRDAGMKCVIVDILGKNFVLIDGQTRRRKCNMMHLEPLEQVIKIKPKASHEEVVSEFGKLNIETRQTKQKKAAERPRKQRKTAETPANAEALSRKVGNEDKKKPVKK